MSGDQARGKSDAATGPSLTEELARFVTGTGYDDLPANILELAKVYALDDLGCGLAGSLQPWSKIVANVIHEAAHKPECTIIGRRWRSDPSGAALVNGVMVGGSEMDHATTKGSAHPGGTVFPAALAMAEREHKDGKAFLTALVLGYESCCRIGRAATRSVEDERGFHGPPTNGPFGSAIAVGKLLGLNTTVLANAMGIAGSHCGGLLEFSRDGAMIKRMHLGRACQMGLESAVLASRGFTGPTTVLEGKYGFFKVFSSSPQPERLLAGLGQDWHMKNIGMRLYATHGTQRSVIPALLEFKAHNKVEPAAIRRVKVSGVPHMITKHAEKEPTTLMGAQYSMPFVVAVSLIRDITDPLIFTDATLWDKEVRELAKKVETVADEQRFDHLIDELAGEVVIEMEGKTHVLNVSGYKGAPGNPLNFDDVCGKFRRYSAPVISTKRAEHVIEMVRDIEHVPDIAQLAALVRA